MIRITISLFAIFIFCISCSSQMNYVFLTPQNAKPFDLNKSKQITLTEQEQEKVSVLLKRLMDSESSKLMAYKEYRYQLIPYLDKGNERIVFINSFCDKQIDYWRSDLVFVLDGGNCYFQAEINLTNETYRLLNINGNA